MKNWNRFPRVILFLTLLTSLLAGVSAPTFVDESVSAAPMAQAASNIVISEFRVRGTNGGNDEFVELFNPTNSSVDISGWLIRGSNNAGSFSTRYPIPSGTIIAPGAHYLIVGSNYSGTVTADGIPSGTAILSSGITDDGGIALTLSDGTTIVDQVGMSSCTNCYSEGTPLISLGTSNLNQSYERDLGGTNGSCMDSGDNSSDFTLITPSNPQNLLSPLIECISVTGVTSTTADGTYTTGTVISINVTFSGLVNVTGLPTLLLETGTIDRSVIYSSGTGSNMLTFDYTVAVGENSGDLDYVASNSLNGGTITGLTGGAAAILTLPNPGAANSLGANKAIVIDTPPSIISFTRQTPSSSSTNADTLIFRVTFSEAVLNVDANDFAVTGTTGTASVSSVSSSVYDVTISGGDLASLNDTVGLNLASSPSITDADGVFDSLPAGEPSIDEVYTVDNIAPTVTVTQASGQLDPATTLPINFAVVFSEPIDASTFTSADITHTGSATGITWGITGTGMNFTLSATAVTGGGTLIPSIAGSLVTDVAGNNNSASTSTDNSITYSPTSTPVPTATATPTVTPGPVAALTLLINEVAWAGTSSTRSGDEWIELYNTGTISRNLNGWRLTVDDGTAETDLAVFSASDVLPAGGFFLLARPLSGACTGTDNINIFTDVVEDKCFSTQLTNSPGQILRLYDSFDTLVDTANSDGGAWPAGSVTNYSSMERRGKILDNTNAWVTYGGTPFAHNRDNALVRGTPKRANWFTTITPTPTRTIAPPTRRPSATNPPPVGRPIINEFLARPGFDWNQDGKVDVYDEFIEITNTGNADINIGGWKLDDEEGVGSSPFALPSVTLKIGERMVFYGLQTNILLSDGGDTVRLMNPSGKIYDARTYSIVKAEDESVCRLPNGYGDWYKDCVPTPGLLNTREGVIPSMPDGESFESPVCNLPDTLPADFLFAECRGFGANIWDSFYWDKFGWQGVLYLQENKSKWESFVE